MSHFLVLVSLYLLCFCQYWFFLNLFQLSEEQNEMTLESYNFLKEVTVLLFHTCFKETNQFYIVFISTLMFTYILFLWLFSAIITTLFIIFTVFLQKNDDSPFFISFDFWDLHEVTRKKEEKRGERRQSLLVVVFFVDVKINNQHFA